MGRDSEPGSMEQPPSCLYFMVKVLRISKCKILRMNFLRKGNTVDAVRLVHSLHRRWWLSLPGSDFQRKPGISSHSGSVFYPNLPRLRLLNFELLNLVSFSFPTGRFSSPTHCQVMFWPVSLEGPFHFFPFDWPQAQCLLWDTRYW